MTLDYERHPPASDDEPRCRPRDGLTAAFIGYFILSALTLPIMRWLWIGELPVLALVQLPKLFLAERLRTGVLMPLVRATGLSRGSFSPDYAMTGPYALVITYLLPIAAVIVWRRLRANRYGPTAFRFLLAAELLDVLMFLAFSRGSGLTIY